MTSAKSLISCGTLLFLILSGSLVHAAFPDGWSSRCELIIQAGQVNTELTNYPLLLTEACLPSDMLDADGPHPALNGGGDIRFSLDSSGSVQLACEVVTFVTDNNPANASAEIWVNVPTVSDTSNTSIWVWYENPGETQPARDAPYGSEAAWNSNFVMVQHLDEDPSGPSPQMIDASAYGNDGTTQGAMADTASVAAVIGNGLLFDEVDDFVSVLDSPSLDSTADRGSFALWINWTDSADGEHQLVMSSSNRYDPTTPDGYEWASQGDGDHFFYPWGGVHGNHSLGPSPFSNGGWHHMAVTFDYATKSSEIYVDGTPMALTYDSLADFWTTVASPDDWLWGGNPDRTERYFDGMMDEIQVSDVVYSEEWIATSYNNQLQPATFVLEQTPLVLSVYSSAASFAFGVTLLNAWQTSQSTVLTNDGNLTEDFVGQVSPLTDGGNTWAISSIANGADSVRAQWSSVSGTGPWNDISAYDTDFTIASSVAPGDSVTFWFRILTPVTTSSFNQHASTLTVTAQ